MAVSWGDSGQGQGAQAALPVGQAAGGGDVLVFQAQTVDQAQLVGLQDPGAQPAELRFWLAQAGVLLVQPQRLLLQGLAVATDQFAGFGRFFPAFGF